MKFKMREPGERKDVDLKDIIFNQGLLEACSVSFNGKEYWNACRDAFIHLEETIRQKSQSSPDLIGIVLIDAAFNPKDGKLIVPTCVTESERIGIYLILRGFVLFHRNAKAHRKGKIDKYSALHLIGYVEYLIGLVNSSRERDEKTN